MPVLGKNAPLTAATPAVGSPNAANGVVTGSVKVTDPDGDVITFGSPITTAKGTVIVDSTGNSSINPPMTLAGKPEFSTPRRRQAGHFHSDRRRRPRFDGADLRHGEHRRVNTAPTPGR